MRSEIISRLIKPLAAVGLILILVALYWYGAVQQLEHVNTDMTFTDQRAYMIYARNLYESGYTFVGGRNRMPVYPAFQSLFYRPSLTDEAFFLQGKYINLALSILLLAGLAFLFRQFFSWLHSFNLLLIVAFTVFIFKAGYFQAELLFYFINFSLFLLMWRLLRRMSWQIAILTGVIAGLAHLTKASILPGLMVFLILAAIKWGWLLLRSRKPAGVAMLDRSSIVQLSSVFLVALFFLATILPYISTSKRVFGHYFYNVNSTFYIWYDSWEEAKQGTRAHGDRVGWPDMPPEEIPSMSKYLREHTPQQIVHRFVDGGETVVENMSESYGYFKYILIYLGLLIFAILRERRRVFEALRSNLVLMIFILLYFTSYFSLYAWYVPIADGNRLVLAQFIPLMFVISCGLHTLFRSSKIKIGRRSVKALTIANVAILAVIVVDIYFVLTERVGAMYGGA